MDANIRYVLGRSGQVHLARPYADLQGHDPLIVRDHMTSAELVAMSAHARFRPCHGCLVADDWPTAAGSFGDN